MITFPYQGLIDKFTGSDIPPKVVQSSLFFRDEDFGIAELPFDLLIDESHSLDFDIPEHAVEDGSSISDHVQERLRTVQITGMFTNHPIGSKKSGYVNDDGTVNEEADEVNVDGVEGRGNVALKKFEKLKEIARSRKPVRLVTSLEVYEEMLFESMPYSRGPEDGESIKFTAKLREVKTAKVSIVRRDGVWNAPAPKTQETDAGKKMAENTKAGKATAVERNSSKIDESITGKMMQP